MTNLLHSASKNETSASDLVNIDTHIECRENNLIIYEILETVINSFTADVISEDEEHEKPNLQPKMQMAIKSLGDTKICIENMQNFYLEKSDKGVHLTNNLNMHGENLMS